MKKALRTASVVFILAVLLSLCGCARRVQLSSGSTSSNARTLTAVVTPEDLNRMEEMTMLLSADFSGSTCYEEISAWGEEHPLVELTYTVSFPGGVTADNSVRELDLTGITDADSDEAIEKLAWLPQLKSVNLGGEENGLSPRAASRFMEQCPDIRFSYHCTLLGTESHLDETSLDLTEASPAEIRKALDTISCLSSLRTIRLGSDEREDALSWEDILALRQAAPNAKIDYRFTLCEQEHRLSDTELDLSYIHITDNGDEVLAAARCMPNLQTLNMDSCGIPNERMAEIRDELPETEVIWRIFFGYTYTLRTNAIKVLASAPSWGGKALGNSDIEVLKYCTKLKYVDLGHNESITDLSVVRYWPDLEVLIIAMNPLGDLTPLADCDNLEYLELFYSKTDDLSPLAGLKNLKHLNVGHCPMLKDISSVYELELERFYLGTFNSTPVPPEQVDRYRELHPDCEVDNSYWESSEGAWRRGAYLEGEALEWYKQQSYYREDRAGYAPRYALLREQFGYDTEDYSVTWKDPTYRFVPYGRT